MSKKYEVREISLIDLMWRVLFAWRKILVFAVVFAVLGGLFAALRLRTGLSSYNQSLKEYNEALLAEEAETEALPQEDAAKEPEQTENVPLTEVELEQVQNAATYRRLARYMKAYMNNSILMQVNPYQEKVLKMYFHVDSEYTYNYTGENTPNYMGALQAAYVNYANNGAMIQTILEETGMDCKEQYLKECISVYTMDSSIVASVIYTDDRMAKAVADALEAALTGRTEEFSEQFGAHTLKLVSEDRIVVSDANTANVQINAMNTLNNYRAQYNALTAAMNEAQLKQLGIRIKKDIAVEEVQQPEVAPPEQQPENLLVEPVKPVFNKKLIVLGFFGGIFLICAWVALQMILDNHLQHGRELSDYFDLPMISSISDKKTYKGVDQFLMNLKTRNQKRMDYATSLAMTGSNLALICRKADVTKLCLTGTEIEKLQEAEMIKEMLQKENIQAVVCNNICYDMNAMREIVEIGTVVVLEASGISIYSEIYRQLELMEQNEIRVLGAVGVE